MAPVTIGTDVNHASATSLSARYSHSSAKTGISCARELPPPPLSSSVSSGRVSGLPNTLWLFPALLEAGVCGFKCLPPVLGVFPAPVS
eukprot:CAMPEP_0179977718 /NCGR_PEP_ID=MMETSP0983-20121128/40242_1 /TAXON_ID=483367 /ORGANISM="non described non described, Strain CCMP 2436" /LENGTH=87 /DNA_ID=CAMNT_0021894991 /DNA_START=207 /DNA_END=466 /DNA_ORIENTATION=-